VPIPPWAELPPAPRWARPSRAFEDDQTAGRNRGFRLRQAYTTTSWAEAGFALTNALRCAIDPPGEKAVAFMIESREVK
jgi:hypothetical protein